MCGTPLQPEVYDEDQMDDSYPPEAIMKRCVLVLFAAFALAACH